MPRLVPCVTSLMLAAAPATAASSYVLQDGLNRAPGVVLHCSADGSNAQPCGTVSQPLVVTAPVGTATASNQAAQINNEQTIQQGIGTPSDGVYSGSGPGSMVAILKSLASSLTSGVPAVPAGGVPVSRSLSIGAQQSTSLFAINLTRRYLAFQVPQNSAVWVNFLGGTAAPNGVDCVYFQAGTFYESTSYVDRGAITIYSPVPITIAAWEG